MAAREDAVRVITRWNAAPQPDEAHCGRRQFAAQINGGERLSVRQRVLRFCVVSTRLAAYRRHWRDREAPAMSANPDSCPPPGGGSPAPARYPGADDGAADKSGADAPSPAWSAPSPTGAAPSPSTATPTAATPTTAAPTTPTDGFDAARHGVLDRERTRERRRRRCIR